MLNKKFYLKRVVLRIEFSKKNLKIYYNLLRLENQLRKIKNLPRTFSSLRDIDIIIPDNISISGSEKETRMWRGLCVGILSYQLRKLQNILRHQAFLYTLLQDVKRTTVTSKRRHFTLQRVNLEVNGLHWVPKHRTAEYDVIRVFFHVPSTDDITHARWELITRKF